MNRELPGHIRKAFKSIDKFLPLVDVVIELVDARMPAGSRIKTKIENAGKSVLIVLGKADLADSSITKKWINKLEKDNCKAIAIDARNKQGANKLKDSIKQVVSNTESNRKVKRAMVIGIPNVGKSTLINSLAGRKAARTANMPGVTRDIQWIKLAGKLELLDLPGVLDYSLLRQGERLRIINSIPGTNQDAWIQARYLVNFLSATGNADILPDFERFDGNFSAYISFYAQKMNFICKGAQPDEYRAASDLIRRFQSGGFGRITLETPEAVLQDNAALFDENFDQNRIVQ